MPPIDSFIFKDGEIITIEYKTQYSKESLNPLTQVQLHKISSMIHL